MKLQHLPMALLLLAGCSKMIPVDSDGVRDDINNRAAEKRATVVLIDGTRLPGRHVELSRTALAVQGRDPRDDCSIPLDSLQNLEFRYHLKGFANGFLAGAAVGGALRLQDLTDGDTNDSGNWLFKFNDQQEALLMAIPLGLLGGTFGGIAGFTYSYRFNVGVEPALPPRWQRAEP